MAGSANQLVYGLGSTLVAIPNGAPVPIIPPATAMGIYFGYQSGGTLVLCPGAGSTLGMVLGTTERISIDGPAKFYMCSTGSTAVCAITWKYSANGISSLP